MFTSRSLVDRGSESRASLNGIFASRRASRGQRLQTPVQARVIDQHSASDVVVVGAGAAGLTAAYFAASKGAKVVFLNHLERTFGVCLTC